MPQAGDLSTQRLNNPQVFTLHTAMSPPLEMTVAAGGIRSFQKGQMTETPPRPVVISTAAQQSGEISLSHGMPQAGDLSTQRFNSPRGLYSHTAMFLRSR